MTACGASGGMGILKSLRDKSDIELILTNAGLYNSGFCYVPDCPRYVVPSGNDPRFADILLDIAKEHKVDLIFPVADEEVFALATKLDAFQQAGIKVIMSAQETLFRGADKGKLMKVAERLRIPHSKTYDIENPDQLKPSDLKFPLVVKPAIARGGQGIFFVQTADELKKAFTRLKKEFGEIPLVQEMIPGGTGSVYMVGLLLDEKSEVKAEFVGRSLQTKFDFGGPATVGESMDAPETIHYAKKIVQATGPWKGVVSVEFKKDEKTGEFKLLEINPRIWGYNFLATQAGIDFPYLAVRTFRGEDVGFQAEYKKGLILVRCIEDRVMESSELKAESVTSAVAQTRF